MKLDKSEINKIQLQDGSEYVLEKVGWKYYIGKYITKGEINIFKCYTYENIANFSSPAPFMPREGVTDISKGKDNYSTKAYNTINKTASVNYYNVSRGSFYIITGKRDFKQLAANSATFEEYIEENGIPNNNLEYEKAFIFYNEECKI
ncbi:MAG: hypothetical protein ABJF11_13495 [Reichenbachiella sp.]|uniref:hypothetical protein n=1 Tax=Reichenbachiella sp. TaxID=2184521 RepID=UPI0032632D02